MKRLGSKYNYAWHRAINRHHDDKKTPGSWKSWMYDAISMADEVPRLAILFGMERRGELRKTHKQCSISPSVPVPDNHLSCCLGVKCAECPELLALDKIEKVTPEQIDIAKAWTCAAHIVSQGGDKMREGYLLTVDDRMYWDGVYQSMSQGPEPPETPPEAGEG
ncbi:MAG: hypothetical protein ACE5HN_08820 [Nitrospiria bacterium]